MRADGTAQPDGILGSAHRDQPEPIGWAAIEKQSTQAPDEGATPVESGHLCVKDTDELRLAAQSEVVLEMVKSSQAFIDKKSYISLTLEGTDESITGIGANADVGRPNVECCLSSPLGDPATIRANKPSCADKTCVNWSKFGACCEKA